jgi:hypothetical protein
MSIYLDKKYINLISTTLEKFKWKKDNLANCRCPICGDSELSKTKARGYFFTSDNSYFYKCHNCGASFNVYKFLEMMSPALFQQYCLERFKDETEFKSEPVKFNLPEKISSVEYDLVSDLDPEHEANIFLKNRKIPNIKDRKFGYTELFGHFAKKFNKDYNLLNDKRIIIPIFDEHNQLIGVQGRSLGNIKPKYITLKKRENVKLIYGIELVNKSKPILVVEGPIDSLFLPNAIACLGSGNFLEIRKKFPMEDLVFVLDNEPRNKQIVSVMEELIKNNEKVCIFPNFIKQKDINDMVLRDINVVDIIDQHTFRGASAYLNFNSWRKC